MHVKIKDFLYYDNCSLVEKYAFHLLNYNVKDLILKFASLKFVKNEDAGCKEIFLKTYTNLFGDRVNFQRLKMNDNYFFYSSNKEMPNNNEDYNFFSGDGYIVYNNEQNLLFKDSIRNGKPYLFDTKNVYKYLLFIFFNKFGEKLNKYLMTIHNFLFIHWVDNISDGLNKLIEPLYVNGIDETINSNNNNFNNISKNFINDFFEKMNKFHNTKNENVDLNIYLEIMFKTFRSNFIFLFDVFETRKAKKLQNLNFSHLYFFDHSFDIDKDKDTFVKKFIFYETFHDNYLDIVTNVRQFYGKNAIIINTVKKSFTLENYFRQFKRYVNNGEISPPPNENFENLFENLQARFSQNDFDEHNIFIYLNLKDVDAHIMIYELNDFNQIRYLMIEYPSFKYKTFMSKLDNTGSSSTYRYIEVIFIYKTMNYYDYENITNTIIKNIFLINNSKSSEDINLLFNKYISHDEKKFNYYNKYMVNKDYTEKNDFRNLKLINEIENLHLYSLNSIFKNEKINDFKKSFNTLVLNQYFKSKEINIYKHIYKKVVIKNFQDFLLVFLILTCENYKMLSLDSKLEVKFSFKFRENKEFNLVLNCQVLDVSLLSFFEGYEKVSTFVENIELIDEPKLNIVSNRIYELVMQIIQYHANLPSSRTKDKLICQSTMVALKRFFCTLFYKQLTELKYNNDKDMLDVFSFSHFLLTNALENFIFLKLSSSFYEYNVYDIINLNQIIVDKETCLKINFNKLSYGDKMLEIKRENLKYYYCHNTVKSDYHSFLLWLFEKKIEKTNPKTYIEIDKIKNDLQEYAFYSEYSLNEDLIFPFLIVDMDITTNFYFCFKHLNIKKEDLENFINKIISDTFFGSSDGYRGYKLNEENINSNPTKKLRSIK